MTFPVEKTANYQNKNLDTTQTLSKDKILGINDDASPAVYKASITLLSMEPLDSRRSLLLKWIPILYKGGATPFFVQRHVDILCKILDVSVNTTYIPGRVLLTWNESSTHKSEHTDSLLYQPNAITLRVSWGFRVEMLERMNNLLTKIEKSIESPRYSIEELHILVDKAAASLPVYNNWILLAAFGVLSGSMAPAFFNGNYYDGLCALVLGAMAGAFAIFSDYFPASFLFMHEIVCSFLSSLFAVIACVAFKSSELHYWPIVLATTIWILPGFSMVIGFMDVVTKFTTTGFITHFAAVFVGLTMAVGYAISIRFLHACGISIPALKFGGDALPNPIRYTLCAVFTSACCVIFQASPRQIPLVIFSVLMCFAMMDSFGDTQEPASYGIIAFALGIITRSCGRMLNQLPEASIYVAMLPLVPGSKIVRSTFRLLEHVHLLNSMTDTKDDYSYNIDGRFPQWIESTFVCVVVAIGFIGSDVLFNKFIMPYIVTPFLGPYFLFPLKRKIIKPYICDPIKRFEAYITEKCCRRNHTPDTLELTIQDEAIPQP